MLTSKERAKLRTLANPLETILQVGKGGIGEQLVKQVDDALRARELIKMQRSGDRIWFCNERLHSSWQSRPIRK